MKITTKQIKELRKKTGISVMQCKKALEESDGNMDNAFALLKKESVAIALKKTDRVLKSGIVQSYIHSNNQVGSMLELFCETDFVAKNKEFIDLAKDIAMQIAAMKPEFVKLEDINDEDKDEALKLFKKEVDEMDKEESIKEKILEGKISDYFAEKTLMEQIFVKDTNLKISNLVQESIQKIGENIEIGQIVHFSI